MNTQTATKGQAIKSQAVDSKGNPAWLLRSDGQIVISAQFVKDSAVTKGCYSRLIFGISRV
ncbi:hypothetical protein ACRS2Z_00015 [Pseudomonas aeruginosa]|uniref:hypothetical protein n=1 Tax=Pseudomonas aeruginosa TaxID=287 RepID=UPI003EE0B9F4